jgi:hypothetical protein
MLTETTLGFLSTLTHRADAKRRVCWLPWSGIYWEDEMPDILFRNGIPQSELDDILRLFAIRVRLWKGQVLSEREQQLWDETYSEVPQWAFFQRIHISAEDERIQDDAQLVGTEMHEALLACADEVTITENDGVQQVSATWQIPPQNISPTDDLTKGQIPPPKKQSWWERLFQRRPDPRKV